MKALLIGIGMVADMHVKAVNLTSGQVSLSGFCARNAERAQEFSRKNNNLKAFSTVDQALVAGGADFAIVLTPPDARLEIAKQLAQHNIPTLMEKPLERTTDAAREIVDIYAAKSVPLGAVLQHRMRPAAIALKTMIDAGQLGEIAAIDVRIPWWRDQSYYDQKGRGTYDRDGGGVLITQAIHTLDLMLQLAGPVRAVTATAATTNLHNLEAEDFVSAGLTFENGAIGALMASTACYPGSAESIALHGTLGSAVLDAASLTLHWRDGRTETIEGAAQTGGGADPMDFGADWHSKVISDFAQAIAAGTPPPISGASALPVHALIDSLQTAARTGLQQKVHP